MQASTQKTTKKPQEGLRVRYYKITDRMISLYEAACKGEKDRCVKDLDHLDVTAT